MSFTVRLTREALEDLQRLEEFAIELALRHGDFELPMRALDAIQRELRILQTNPYTCRKVGSSKFVRELIVPFGGTGYVALFEIVSEHEVLVAAFRHQREDDYH